MTDILSDKLDEMQAEGWLIQREVQDVAIYPNASGDVVVKEMVAAFPSVHETVIVIARANVPAAIAALRRAAGLDDEVAADEAPKTKDRTAAERMRRYRNKRNTTLTHDRGAQEPLRLVAAE